MLKTSVYSIFPSDQQNALLWWLLIILCIIALILSLFIQDARHAAEEEIYTNLNQKIDQFLQLADYDWTAAQGGGQASDYLSDLIAFLCSTFAVFTHLPVSVSLLLHLCIVPLYSAVVTFCYQLLILVTLTVTIRSYLTWLIHFLTQTNNEPFINLSSC